MESPISLFDPDCSRWNEWCQSALLRTSPAGHVAAQTKNKVSPTAATKDAKYVFAHFVAGVAAHMSLSDWATDIALAKSAKIDGFAINIASGDTNNSSILSNAYRAAETAGGFKLFLSFDYSNGPWSREDATALINNYKTSPAQFFYRGQPFVSTFTGSDEINAKTWFGVKGIKAATNCFFVPNWSVDPTSNAFDQFGRPDGAFLWQAWPNGANDMTPDEDEKWMAKFAVDGRPFMMSVSPWFYTNLPNWRKNWLWRGDDLWHDRWMQAIALQPAILQILTWNDYGESHYIGPIRKAGIPAGAHYVNGMPHEGWLADLPQYITAYKNGSITPLSGADQAEERITYWYKLNPGRSGSSDNTTGNTNWQTPYPLDPWLLSQDKVFVTVLLKQPSDVTVRIGSNKPSSFRAASPGINHFSVPMNGQTGVVSFTASRAGQVVLTATGGREITTQCVDNKVNWNAYVGTTSSLFSNPIEI